jgi:hypothetical protein
LKSVTWCVLAFVMLSAVSGGGTRLKFRHFADYCCVRIWLYCFKGVGIKTNLLGAAYRRVPVYLTHGVCILLGYECVKRCCPGRFDGEC